VALGATSSEFKDEKTCSQWYMKRKFREIRLHSDKPPQEFLCDLLHQGDKQVVLRHISSNVYTVGATTIEKKSITIAHYWEDRNYILWIFKKPDVSIIGHLFHIARDVEIGEDYVRYVDLELDIWFSPDGNATVLDEEEVKDYYNKGIFDDRTIALIEGQKAAILENFRTIIKDVWSNEEPF
jgi:protein associated with RNAse G/E